MKLNKLITLKNKYKNLIYLALIIVFSIYFRVYGINWDSNYYFHPDERAIVMFTIPLKFPQTLSEFLSVNSPLNPHFFAYGNFPLYLLKIAGEIAGNINPLFKIYGGIHIVGRLISVLADTTTVLLVYLIGTKLFSKRTGLFAALLYGVSVFPIQTAHFYAVDPLLTLFMIATIYSLILFIKKPTVLKSIFVGLFFGFSIATKISALILIIDIVFAFGLILFLHKNIRLLPKLTLLFLIMAISTTFIFFSTQPYVLIDFPEFIKQTQLQSQMSNNAFIFPYTLQYVGIIPYFYEFKNIYLWGEGILTGTITTFGFFVAFYLLLKRKIKGKRLISLLIFYLLSYFIVFGSFAVGWMRYMLPIYPALSVFGGFLISEIAIKKIPKKYLENYYFKKSLLLGFIILLLIYPVSFLSIYKYPNTRIQASDWINNNIPIGSTIAIEHWDDALPVYNGQNYTQLVLPLYDPDTSEKWTNINSTLKATNYIIIASNRLYTPLQKLTDCKHLPPNRCYPITASYYRNLFKGLSNFKKVAEFTDYPTIPFINIPIHDDSADESFTVYDHPKVMIFKKQNSP